jgi:FtsH-binding integral membrane protein
MLILERMAGGLGIATSIGGLFVLLTIYRKVVKWAWYYVLVVGLIGWVNNLIANILFKNSLIIMIIVAGLVLIAIGLILPARVFLCEKKNT